MPELTIKDATLTLHIDPEVVAEALSHHVENIDIDGDIEGLIVNALEDIDIEDLVKDAARDRVQDLDIFEVLKELLPEKFDQELEEVQGYMAERGATVESLQHRLHQQARHTEELRDRLEALHSESVWAFLRRKIFGGRVW